MGKRLGHENVEGGPGDALLPQRRGKSRFVHEGAAGGIDEKSSRLHAAQLRIANQAARLRSQGGVQRDEITLAEQFIEWDKFHSKFFGFGVWHGIAGEQAKVESCGAACHGQTDASEANDTERFSGDIASPGNLP